MEKDIKKEHDFATNGNLPYPAVELKPQVKHKRVWVNILLFVLSVITTMMVGAGNLGYNAWEAVTGNLPLSLFEQITAILPGWKYSFAVLLILTAHEFGHYFAARWHKMFVSLPYYIPLPVTTQMFHFGTMGAFIRIKSPIPNRRALMDVAVGGPLGGLVFCLLFLFYGYLSLPSAEAVQMQVDAVHMRMGLTPELLEGGLTLTLGKSLLFAFFNDFVGGGKVPMSEIYHFPYIFAGWVGLLVTAINLLPIGQLDGGHVVYALFGPKAKKISQIGFISLGGLTVILSFSLGMLALMWVPMMIILSLIGLRHPPTMNDYMELNKKRRWLGWLCIGVFVVSFMPLPIYF